MLRQRLARPSTVSNLRLGRVTPILKGSARAHLLPRAGLTTSVGQSTPTSAGTSPSTAATGESDEAGETIAAAAAHTILFEDEDEALSLDPKDYDFEKEDLEDVWERLEGTADQTQLRSRGSIFGGQGRAKERLAKKFPSDLPSGSELGEEDEDEDEDDDDLPSFAGGGRSGSRGSESANALSDQSDESEEQNEVLTPQEKRQREKEEEQDKMWSQIVAPLIDDIETEIMTRNPRAPWYPPADEYEGDGYDDYSHTLQNSWDSDSPYHRDYEYDEKEFKNHFAWCADGNQHIINVGRHTKTTKGGRVFSYSATVIDGNGNGRAGWGYGKGPTLSDAVLAAQKDCERNSFFIDRYKGVCLSESIRFSYKKCTVELFALPEGRLNPTSSQVMQLVFNAFGLKYVAGKWLGSKNKTKRIKTLFMALQQIEHPDYQSEKLGMKLFKTRKIPRKHGRVWSYD